MKIFIATGLIILNLIFFCKNICGEEMLLIPDLTYLKEAEPLIGKLLFHVWKDKKPDTNALAAQIYELDLEKALFSTLTEAPKGRLTAADDGDILCVGDWLRHTNVQAFIYSVHQKTVKRPQIDGDIRKTLAAGGYVFFEKAEPSGSSILEYNLMDDLIRTLQLPQASLWHDQYYDKMHIPAGQTNILHFHYRGFGKLYKEGRNYESGVYALDLASQKIRWFGDSLDDEDDQSQLFKSWNEEYVYFAGKGGPFAGSKLIRSNRHPFLGAYSSKVEHSKILAQFPWLTLQHYVLLQMSPDRRFALIDHTEAEKRSSEPFLLGKHTYYLVDAVNGGARVLIKEEVQFRTGQYCPEILWIRGR